MRLAIVGAGIIGRLLALEALRAGCRPVLFDRDDAGDGRAAAWVAAGMLTPWSELEGAETSIWRLGLASLALWPRLAAELGDVGFRACGSVVVAHRRDSAELARFQRILARHADEDVEGSPQVLDGRTLAALEPALAGRFGEALHLPAEACVDNRRVMAALANRLREAGARWHEGVTVDAVHPHEIVVGGVVRRFDCVVDCRGLGARAQLPGLRGVRGELLQVHAPAVQLGRMVRLMHPRYRLYLVPGADQHYLLGATQIESEDDSPISVRSALELLSALYSLHEGFAEARIVAMRSGCRPALPDNLPLLHHEPGLLCVNGLFRHGFLLGPLLARRAWALVCGARDSEQWQTKGGISC